jgi:DNA-binding transcriptional regulator YhcF (GntR family)
MDGTRRGRQESREFVGDLDRLKCPPYQDDSTVRMDWRVDLGADAPPSRQLARAILDGIARGELAGGDQLPSVRQLAAKALVNHNTVARAYRDLEQMGVVRGHNGLGVFVSASGPRIARDERRDDTLAEFRRAALAAMSAGHDVADLAAQVSRLRSRRIA